jgi:hypothetical protein
MNGSVVNALWRLWRIDNMRLRKAALSVTARHTQALIFFAGTGFFRTTRTRSPKYFSWHASWRTRNHLIIKKIKGEKTTDPVFGLPALWISEVHKDEAKRAGYTAADTIVVKWA